MSNDTGRSPRCEPSGNRFANIQSLDSLSRG